MKQFATLLHEVGQRATPARIAVLAVLEKEKRPISVEKIISIIGEQHIDYVTAYRTITMLKKSGLVRQIDFQHNHAHYELASLGDHHHVVCTKCNKVVDIHCGIPRMMKDALQSSGFSEISQHSLEFFGLCKKCAV